MYNANLLKHFSAYKIQNLVNALTSEIYLFTSKPEFWEEMNGWFLINQFLVLFVNIKRERERERNFHYHFDAKPGQGFKNWERLYKCLY
jgi:hypothetical protein